MMLGLAQVGGVGEVSECAHLLLGLGDGLVQHEGEVLDLPLQEVVVCSEGPQRWLEAQQVQTDSCNIVGHCSANHSAAGHHKAQLSQSQPP